MDDEQATVLPDGFELVLDGRRVESRRVTLSVAEAAMVLDVDDRGLMLLIAQGYLRDVSSEGEVRLGPSELAGLAEERVSGGLLGEWSYVVLVALLSGSL